MPPTPSECNCNCKSICKLYFGTPSPPGECYCNCKNINWTETLPSSKSRDTKTRTDIKNLHRTKVRYCSVVSESVVICQLTLKMVEEIDFENWRISNFKGLVTLTLDRVIRHTVVHHSSTSTYIPNFIGIGKTFLDRRTYGWTYERTYGHLSPIYILLGRLFGVDLKSTQNTTNSGNFLKTSSHIYVYQHGSLSQKLQEITVIFHSKHMQLSCVTCNKNNIH